MGAITRDALLKQTAGYVGMTERTGRNDIWFSDDWGITGYAWCFAFVQSCFYYTGAQLPLVSMYCPTGIQYARDNGQAVEVGQGDPLPGDIVFFSWDMNVWPRNRAGTGDHVGIVESYDGGDTVQTIEGNISNSAGVQGVWRKSRSISGTVVCFWRPPVFADDGGFGPAGTIDQPATPTQPAPTISEEDEPMRQYRDVSTGTVYAVAGLFKTPLESDAVRQSWMTMGILLPPDQYFEQNAHVLSELTTVNQDTFAVLSAGINNSFANLSAQLNAIPGRLVAPPAPAEPFLDVEASLQNATPAQLVAALTGRLNGA